MRIASIQPPFQSSYDEQTYVRVVPAQPQQTNELTASDFGRVTFGTLYSGKHFLQNMVVNTDLVIPLDPSILGQISNGNTLILALINGHELENVDHWPTVNVHTHGFSAYAPSSGTPPLLRLTYGGSFTRCPAETYIYSVSSDVTTSITFKNTSRQPIQIHWIDSSGMRVLYSQIPARRFVDQPTYLTHPWVVTDKQGNCKGVYYPDGQPRVVSIR